MNTTTDRKTFNTMAITFYNFFKKSSEFGMKSKSPGIVLRLYIVVSAIMLLSVFLVSTKLILPIVTVRSQQAVAKNPVQATMLSELK